MNTHSEPFHQKLALILISIGLISLGLYFGRGLLLPFLFSLLFAALLLPITNFLIRRRISKILSIFIPLFIAVILSTVVLYLLFARVINFAADLPELKAQLIKVGIEFQRWVRENTDISIWKQNQYIGVYLEDSNVNVPNIAKITLGSMADILTSLVLLPVYTFLILYYRVGIKSFLISVFQNNSASNVSDILTESATIAQRYITGLTIETAVVFALNTAGFMILGVKYAVFMALLAALLNLVPYIGMLVANVICMFITLVSAKTGGDVLWVGLVLGIVQILDNNFLMPLIVGNKVRINSLVTILGVLVGGALCGIPGMFLAIPALAVSKVICDNVPELKPWGRLLGDGSLEVSKSRKEQSVREPHSPLSSGIRTGADQHLEKV
ncbi:MAG: AI-2E family transporter [Cytophagales bacterium]|nr:AI-2E family transporter [Cytophagales bacterium]